MVESRARLESENRRLAKKAERIRYDANHNPVDDLGLTYGDTYPNPPTSEPAIGGDRHRQAKGGTLDPYHRDAPGEDSPQGSPERPKAPPVFQATADGRLYEPAREEKDRLRKQDK